MKVDCSFGFDEQTENLPVRQDLLKIDFSRKVRLAEVSWNVEFHTSSISYHSSLSPYGNEPSWKTFENSIHFLRKFLSYYMMI